MENQHFPLCGSGSYAGRNLTMKRKTIIILCLMVLLGSSLFASFMQIGPTYSINFPIDTESDTPVDFKGLDWGKFRLGADLRFNIGYLTLEEEAKASFSEQLLLDSFDVFSSVNLKVKFFFMEFFVGGGLKVAATKYEAGWLYNGAVPNEFADVVKSATLFYKGAFDINMGRVSLSFSAMFPTSQSINTLSEVQSVSVLDALKPSLKDTTVSVGLLVNIF